MTEIWIPQKIADQHGRIAAVTGANGGLGVETCKELARAGARVIMACRDLDKGKAAAGRIRDAVPHADLDVRYLDLASLASIRSFSKALAADIGKLDLLINNAGIIGMPLRRTEDGFESMMGVNCLGHFALTGLVLPLLQHKKAARVVAVGTSSHPHMFGHVDVEDLNWEKRRFRSIAATGQAKLALQMCTFELNARLAERSDRHVLGVVAHPGISKTNISLAGADLQGATLKKAVMRRVVRATHQSAWMGALPTLYAATSPAIEGGDYIGPRGVFELAGYPKKMKTRGRIRDRERAGRLWDKAEELTGVRYL